MDNQISSLPSQPLKRNTAHKFQINQILEGKPILNNERLHHLEINEKEIIRVNVIANVTDKYTQEGEKQYGSLTIDDGTGQIRIKAFGEDIKKIANYALGDTIVAIGPVRIWNNELYITPEIIKKKDPQFLLVRKLEIQAEQPKPFDKEARIALKDQILQQVRGAEKDGGIGIDKLIMELKENPGTINQEIKRLLEEGLIYEPRPGKLRYLG